jgi:predicted metal-dependent phosphoesterase TrpH
MLIDLQLHSRYSDGYLTPTELVEFVFKKGVKVASITDHNTVGGIDEFRKVCKKKKIKAIVGMELYVKLNNTSFNLLWYNFDETDPALHDLLRDSQIRRRRQVRNILIKLSKKGFSVNINKILDKYTHYVPINHVVDDFMAVPANLKRIKKDLKTKEPREGDVIKQYFRNKNIGIIRNSFINFDRILKLRKKIGGQLVLCHPAKHNYINIKLWEKLKELGLDGVEVLSPHHSYGAVMYIQYLARELDLIATGGSDFHRFEGNNSLVQDSWDYYKIDSDSLRRVKEII